MTIQILATKLYVPQPRSKRVLRSNLIERLNHGRHRKLTLISAPAGFGKTSLLSEWIDQNEFQTAWISLDEGDGEPVHFLSYLISALQKINPDIRIKSFNEEITEQSLFLTPLNDLSISVFPDVYTFIRL